LQAGAFFDHGGGSLVVAAICLSRRVLLIELIKMKMVLVRREAVERMVHLFTPFD